MSAASTVLPRGPRAVSAASTAGRFASVAMLVPRTSASTIECGYRGASTNCATPVHPA